MDAIALQTLLIAVVVGISCGLLGVFLILRKMSMMVDAISHTVLLGIVLAYMVVRDLTSPWLMVGTTIVGVLTVVLIELLVSTKRTTEDAATGAIFPFLFSLAVILITTRFRNTHLDSHAISGNLEFAAYEQLRVFGVEIGSKTLYTNLFVLLLLVLVLVALFKELKLSSFDKALAKTLGLMPGLLHYVLMTMVSLTAVTSFNAVGSILVIAMMIGPAATALLVTKNLKSALFMSAFFAAINAVSGYTIAMFIFKGHVNIASTIATVTFMVFSLVWIFEPRKGLITTVLRKLRQKREFEVLALVVHVAMHQNTVREHKELHVDIIREELNWNTEKYRKRLRQGIDAGLFSISNNLISLTAHGKEFLTFKLGELTQDV